MSRIVWITGRAATGKSTLVAAVATFVRAWGREPMLLCDEQILLGLASADTAHEHHEHPYGDHRIAWRTGALFDDSVRAISDRLLPLLHHGATPAVVELARGGRHGNVDLTYRRALDLIDPQIWPHSTVFRLNTDFPAQLERNRSRGARTGHSTPDEIMRQLYRHDDPDSFQQAGIPVTDLPDGDLSVRLARILPTLHQAAKPHNMLGAGAATTTT